jgi:hypothetical protein
MSNLFGLPSWEQFEEQLTILREMAGKMGVVGTIGSWKDVQSIVRKGQGNKYFAPGDALVGLYDGNPTIWDVIGVNHDTPTAENLTYSLTIQSRDCLQNVMFDAPEALYYATTALSAGTHIFSLEGVKYKLTTTQPIPAGGQIYISTWSDPYIPTKATTYGADRTTVIESGLDVTTATGTDTLTPVNHQQRCRYGSNNYMESAIKQWLNSTSSSFAWTPKTNFDRPPTGSPYTGAGFLKLLDPELVEVIGAVNKQVARNTLTDGGGQDAFSDKVFLLSRTEVYGGTEGTTTGEEPYAFYSSMASSPTTDVLSGRIKLLNNSPRTWWLRSPAVGYATHARYVDLTGAVYNNYVVGAYGLSPACCIL